MIRPCDHHREKNRPTGGTMSPKMVCDYPAARLDRNRSRVFTRRIISTRKGFTLVEVTAVVAIIGALAAIALHNYISYVEKARNTKIITEMKQIDKEILLFAFDNDRYPDDLAEIGLDGMRDLWGNPYQYLNLANVKGKGKMRKDRFLVPINSDYDLYSMGPDGRSATPLTSKLSRDDIIRASNGRYFGVASEY